MKRYGSIYVVTNTVTGEQYVGQTRQKAARRWKTHVNTANSQATQKYKLTKAIIEYGKESFAFVEIFSAFDATTLNSAEIKFIEELSPVYNIAKGGAGHRGVVASAETRKARSERLKRQWANTDWRSKTEKSIRQASQTPEATERGKKVAAIGIAARWADHEKKQRPPPKVKTCKQKRDPAIGRRLAAQAKWKPVYCPELQCSFLSQKAAAEFLGVLSTSVANAIKQKGRVAGKYTLEKVA